MTNTIEDSYSKEFENSSSTNDYYDMAKKQEYSALLSKELQLENAKQNALKYTQNEMANNGLNSTGYGSSALSGINAQYMNAFGAAQNNYQSNMDTLNYNQKVENENQQNNTSQSVLTMITNASDDKTLNNLLVNYGYGSVDNNGNFNFNATKPETMSDNDWLQMKYYYDLQKNSIDSNNDSTQYFDSIDGFRNATIPYANGTDTIQNKYSLETDYLASKINTNAIKVGDSIAIKNAEGQTLYVQYTRNGIAVIDENTYKNSSNKGTITYDGRNITSSF